MEDPATVPTPVPSDTVAPFLTACSKDKRYLELFKCFMARYAESLPFDRLEQLDLVMRRAYPKTFRDRGNKAPSRPKLVDWRTIESARKRKRIHYLTQQRMWKTDRRQLVRVIPDDAQSIPGRLPSGTSRRCIVGNASLVHGKSALRRPSLPGASSCRDWLI